jgi:hypothetical protein
MLDVHNGIADLTARWSELVKYSVICKKKNMDSFVYLVICLLMFLQLKM